MAPTIRTNRFQPLRTPSLRRLKTALSPVRRSSRSSSPSSSTGTTSPLTRASSPDSHRSAGSTSSSIRALLLLRRKPSVMEIELEEERRSFGEELSLLEPRPHFDAHELPTPGIFEVLDGRM